MFSFERISGAKLERLLVELDAVLGREKSGFELGPISWRIFKGERAFLKGFDSDSLSALENLLGGLRQPVSGVIVEPKPVQFISDRLILKNTDLRHTIGEYLASPAAPDMVWLDGRKRSARVIIDRLGLSPRDLRQPLRHSSDLLRIKFVAIRLLLTRADILLISDLITQADPPTMHLLQNHWADFPGAMLAAASQFPGPYTTEVIAHEGGVQVVQTSTENETTTD